MQQNIKTRKVALPVAPAEVVLEQAADQGQHHFL